MTIIIYLLDKITIENLLRSLKNRYNMMYVYLSYRFCVLLFIVHTNIKSLLS